MWKTYLICAWKELATRLIFSNACVLCETKPSISSSSSSRHHLLLLLRRLLLLFLSLLLFIAVVGTCDRMCECVFVCGKRENYVQFIKFGMHLESVTANTPFFSVRSLSLSRQFSCSLFRRILGPNSICHWNDSIKDSCVECRYILTKFSFFFFDRILSSVRDTALMFRYFFCHSSPTDLF